MLDFYVALESFDIYHVYGGGGAEEYLPKKFASNILLKTSLFPTCDL